MNTTRRGLWAWIAGTAAAVAVKPIPAASRLSEQAGFRAVTRDAVGNIMVERVPMVNLVECTPPFQLSPEVAAVLKQLDEKPGAWVGLLNDDEKADLAEDRAYMRASIIRREWRRHLAANSLNCEPRGKVG